jgi:peptide/nickel transport system substrate-binding protein
MLNAAKPPLDNPMVRQAIWLAIDQQQIIDKLFQGEGQKVAVLNPALDFWLLPEADLKPYITPDPAKAKQLLSAAGYEDGLDLELSFVTATYIPDEAELLIAQLKAAGINATAKAVETATWVNQYFLTKAYTLTITSVLENVTPTNNLLWFHSKGTGAYLNYSNPAAEALIDKQGTELDPEKRKQTVLEAQRTLLADWPALAPLPAKTLFSSHLARVGGIDFALRSNLLRHFDFYLKS